MCYFEAYLRKFVFEALGMTKTGFLPPNVEWPLCAPAGNDTITDAYQNILLQVI